MKGVSVIMLATLFSIHTVTVKKRSDCHNGKQKYQGNYDTAGW